MGQIIKRVLCLIASACWFGFALGFGMLLFRYLFSGAGVQFFGFVLSSTSVIVGFIHVSGFALATFFSFGMAVWLGSFALPEDD